MAQTAVNPVDGGTGQGLNTAAELIGGLGTEEEQEATEETEELETESAESEDAEASSEAEEEEEGTILETLDDVASALEADPDALMDLKLKFKAAGEDVESTLRDLVTGNQRDADYRRKTQELSEKRQSLETDYTERTQQLDGLFQAVGAGIGQVKQVVMAQMNSPEMQQLRTANPQEWSARQLDAQRMAQALDVIFNNQASAYAQHRKGLSEKAEKEFQELRQAEAGRVTEYIPDWSESKSTEISNYLISQYGFRPQDLQEVVDSRHIAIAHKALLYDRLKQVEGKTKVKVNKIQKALGGGKSKTAMPKQKKQLSAAKARHAKSKNVRSAADVIGQLNLDALQE